MLHQDFDIDLYIPNTLFRLFDVDLYTQNFILVT